MGAVGSWVLGPRTTLDAVSDIGDEWRSRPLNEVIDSAMKQGTLPHERAGIELQRRTIVSLERASSESARASRRLLVATWVLITLTLVLVVLTVAIISGD
jgi:hypothetical protein